jgi:hypothetical protein
MSTRSTPRSLTSYRKWHVTDPDGTEYDLEDGQFKLSWTDTVTFGDNIPGWRQRLRDGLSATTSMTGVRVSAQYTPGAGTYRTLNQWGEIGTMEGTGNFEIDLSIPSGDPASIDTGKSDNEALGRFNSRIRDRITAFQGGVFLGELGQTIQTIRNPARGLRSAADDAVRVLRRIRSSGFSGVTARNASRLLERVEKNLADQWLEIQFGWKPLLHDIDDGCKALAILNTGQSLSTGRVSASAEVVANPVETNSVKRKSNSWWRVHTVSKDQSMTIYRGALRVDAQNPASMLGRLLGFDPSSFLPTVWELIPYSFLIDYFTNVGDIVEGFSQIGIRLAWCNRTSRQTLSVESSSSSDLALCKANSPLVNYHSVTFVPSKCVVEKTLVTRNEFNGVRIPGLTFSLPGSGSLRWLNIAALIASRDNDRNWSYGN